MNTPRFSLRWSAAAEYALLVGSGAGAAASLTTQNAAIASLPITALVALGLLNRRRIDRLVQSTGQQLADLEGQFTQNLTALQNQVSALPTPEVIRQLQRSTLEHSDRALVQFSAALAETQQNLEHRLSNIANPDLSHLYQETAQLQDQYAYVCTTLGNLSKQIERLSHMPRLEATEADVAQLKTDVMQVRVSLESLNSESKTAHSTLQDAIRHLDRRLRQVPNGSDPNLLKAEVRELIKAVSDLVPRREFAALTEKFQTLQESQESLRQTLDRLRSGKDGVYYNGHVPHDEGDLRQVKTELLALAEEMKQVEDRLQAIAVPFDITAEIRGTTATYLSGLQWQLSLLEQQTQELAQRQANLPMAAPGSLLQGQSAALDPVAKPGAKPNSVGMRHEQWLMAFRGVGSDEPWSAIDQALFQALDGVTERLVLVWPWSSSMALEEMLVDRFAEVLKRGCHLEIGWCHPGDRTQGRFLKAIAQQWQLTSSHRQRLKVTLNQLLPLKQTYPDHFSFKILGTDEQFLVCDRTYAIVGLQALPVASSTFPELDLRIQTSELAVINQLLHRFDHPDALPEKDAAYFNRAVTRYDLHDIDGAIADFTQALRLNPQDAITLNNRAVALAEQKAYGRVLEDLNQALTLDESLFAALCNRGWLLMHQGQTHAAIANFERAMQTQPTSPLPYFYRGMARQRMDDRLGAIADFTQVIQIDPNQALPYCYRGAAYQRQGNIPAAIADLEMAASLLHAKRDHRALAQVTQLLSTLKQVELARPIHASRTPSP